MVVNHQNVKIGIKHGNYVDNIVIGHTIQDNIKSKCDDKIWRIDVGMWIYLEQTIVKFLKYWITASHFQRINLNQ